MDPLALDSTDLISKLSKVEPIKVYTLNVTPVPNPASDCKLNLNVETGVKLEKAECGSNKKEFSRSEPEKNSSVFPEHVKYHCPTIQKNIKTGAYDLEEHDEGSLDADVVPNKMDCPSSRKIETTTGNTHAGEKAQNKCEKCGKIFASVKYLTIHKEGHTGVKSYDCLTCGKCFATRGTRMKHMGRHHVKKLFSCYVCKKGFSYLKDLNAHRVSHKKRKSSIKTKLNKCNLCEKSYHCLAALTKHMLTISHRNKHTLQVKDP